MAVSVFTAAIDHAR
ncbi:hypothetical protein VCHC55A1_2121, partial [Vibrio cholerae HC-55A1]